MNGDRACGRYKLKCSNFVLMEVAWSKRKVSNLTSGQETQVTPGLVRRISLRQYV